MVNKNNRHIPMIIGDFYIPVPIIVRVSRDKIREDIGDLNNTVNLLNLTDIYRTLNSTMTECAFLFKCSENIYQERSYLEHKTNLRKVSQLCVLVSPFPEHLLHSNRTSVFLKTHLINMRASLVAQC